MSASKPPIQHWLKTGALRYNGNKDTACGSPWIKTTEEYDPEMTCEACISEISKQLGRQWTPKGGNDESK